MSRFDRAFDRAFAYVIRHEGGYVYDKADPGGETKWGISKRSYPDVNIRELSLDQAKGIYRRDWWDRYRYGDIPDIRVAAKVFDLAVNLGPKRAHRVLQRALTLCGVPTTADGILGPQTRGNLAAWLRGGEVHARLLLALLCLEAARLYVTLPNGRFLRGWIKRALDMDWGSDQWPNENVSDASGRASGENAPASSSASDGGQSSTAARPLEAGETTKKNGKPLHRSKTFWGVVALAAGNLLGLLPVAAPVQAVLSVAGAALATYGRAVAEEPIKGGGR